MSLLLISSECRFLDSILESIKEDVHFIIIDKFETPLSFKGKISSEFSNEDLSNVTNIGLVFDNTGNRAPFFEFSPLELTSPTIESQEITVYNDEESSTLEILNSNIFTPISEFISSGKFFSVRLCNEINNIKTDNNLLTEIDIFSINAITIENIHNDLSIKYENNQSKYFDITIKSPILLLGPKVVPIDGKIYTAEDLFSLMETTSSTDLSRDYELMNNIDMSGYSCQSIGRIGNPFKGNFNGNGYTISINETLQNNYYGLFRYVGALDIVCNIQGINIKYLNSGFGISIDPGVSIAIGGFCGSGIKTIFENCNVEYTQNTTLSCNYNSINSRVIYIGGFGGSFNTCCQVKNCNLISNGDLNINTNPVTNSSSILCAGFIGELYISSSAIKSSCLVKGDLNINVNKNISTANNWIGGFIGNLSADNGSQLNLINDCLFELEGDYNLNYNIINISTSTNYIGGSGGQISCSSIDSLNFIFHKNINMIVTSPNNQNNIGGAIGFMNLTKINNLNIKVLGDIDIQWKTSNQTTNVFGNYATGCIGTIFGTSISNFQFNSQNINISYEQTGYTFYLAGVIGYIQNSSTIPSNLDNATFIVKNINLEWIKTGTTQTGNSNIGGFVGQNNTSTLSSYFNNLSYICDNLTIDIIQNSPNIFNTLRLGGLCGSYFNISEVNSNMCINGTYTLNLDIKDNGNIPRNIDIGGAYGSLRGTTVGTYSSQNCTSFINNYIQNITVASTAVGGPASLIISNGGMIGRCANFASCFYNLDNYNVFFGKTTIISGPSDSSFTSSRNGGVIGYIESFSTTLNNCVVVFNDYTIDGFINNKTIATNNGSVNNVRSITFGSPITSSGVQDVDGPNEIDTILDILGSSINTQIYQYFLLLRQNIQSLSITNFTPSQLVYSILSNNTFTPLVFRNSAIQNSMFFTNISEIKTDFGTIKSSLEDYSLGYSDLVAVYYLRPDSVSKNVYTINVEKKSKIYYLFNPISKIDIKIGSEYPKVLEYNSQTDELNGVNFDNTFTSVDKSYSFDSNGANIKVLGVGSALLEVNPPKKESSNWWWITIIIVIGVIFLILIFLYFFDFCGFRFKKSEISLDC